MSATRQADAAASAGLLTTQAQMVEIQRARILAAATEESAQRGADEVTVTHVVTRAGVSRRTFYELFDGREACLLAAFDEALEHVTRCVREEDDPSAGWAERIRMALATTLSFLHAQPAEGRLLVVGSLGIGPRVFERRQRVFGEIVAFVDQGRAHTKAGGQPPPLTAEGIVGGVLSIVHARLLEPDGESPLALLGPLMGTIVLPYLGAPAARRELARPALAPAPLVPLRPADPLLALEMRLTYRTIRALMSVAANPGSSNREIGTAADIHDQGQVSKLLTRLHRLGLIENGPAGAARGAPNAWVLTDRGRAIERAIGRRP
jgi:AcrR family transcriptional regulator